VKEVDCLTFFILSTVIPWKTDRVRSQGSIGAINLLVKPRTELTITVPACQFEALSGSEVPRIFQLTEDPSNQKNH
jgi:hypothetical protein